LLSSVLAPPSARLYSLSLHDALPICENPLGSLLVDRRDLERAGDQRGAGIVVVAGREQQFTPLEAPHPTGARQGVAFLLGQHRAGGMVANGTGMAGQGGQRMAPSRDSIVAFCSATCAVTVARTATMRSSSPPVLAPSTLRRSRSASAIIARLRVPSSPATATLARAHPSLPTSAPRAAETTRRAAGASATKARCAPAASAASWSSRVTTATGVSGGT